MKKIVVILLLATTIVLLNNCTEKSDSAPAEEVIAVQVLPVTLNRLSTTQFEVLIDSSTLSGFSTTALTFTISGGTATAFADAGSGIYKATVTATNLSGEIPMTLSWSNYSKSITALIFPNIDAAWDQPEAVPGYVNTDGWEDSPEISPDGNYLIVSTYSPVSLFQCITDGLLVSTPSCNANSFATLSSERPNFPGAARILSPTSINHTISMLNPPDTTNAYPPVSSYAFVEQADGSFKQPIPIYVDWEAYTWGAPFGFNFKEKISDNVYKVNLTFGDPSLGTGNKLQSAQLDFSGSTVVLGTMTLVAGALTKSNWAMTPLNIPGLATQAGNPGSSVYGPTGDGYLFWDDESLAANTRELYFATETAAGVYGSKQTVGLSQAGLDEYQPYFFENRLYFSLIHGAILSSQLTTAADPSLIGSWSANRLEIGVDSGHTHAGRIGSMGEPSLYTDSSGKKWLYFAYSIVGSGNMNLNIGRVRAK